jgi:hypothetical protein
MNEMINFAIHRHTLLKRINFFIAYPAKKFKQDDVVERRNDVVVNPIGSVVCSMLLQVANHKFSGRHYNSIDDQIMMTIDFLLIKNVCDVFSLYISLVLLSLRTLSSTCRTKITPITTLSEIIDVYTVHPLSKKRQ